MPLELIGVTVAVVAAAYLLWRWLRKRKEENELWRSYYDSLSQASSADNSSIGDGAEDEDGSGGTSGEDWYADLLREQEMHASQYVARQLERDAASVLESGDEQLTRLLSEAYGKALPSQGGDPNPDLVREIARTVQPHFLRVLSAASQTQRQFEDLELTAKKEREVVPYVADEINLTRLGPEHDFSQIMPEDLAMGDDVFFANFVQGDLSVIENVELTKETPSLYVLIDLSGSTDYEKSNGATRVQWEAGVTLKLMLRALAGQAKFSVRFFGDTPYELVKVESEAQAQQMIDMLLRLNHRNSGTDIMAALEQAVKDIGEQDNTDVEYSDILLVSDGESPLDEYRLEQLFNPDSKLRLHVALIGVANPILERFATSYQVY